MLALQSKPETLEVHLIHYHSSLSSSLRQKRVYSMMVYKGPGTVSRIRHELADLMIQNGKRTIEDVVGMDHEEIFWRRREEEKLLHRRRESRTVVLKPLQP